MKPDQSKQCRLSEVDLVCDNTDNMFCCTCCRLISLFSVTHPIKRIGDIAYGPQSERPDTEKVRFYDEMASEWNLGSSSEIIVSLGDLNGHVGKRAEDFEGAHGGEWYWEKKCGRKKIAGVL